MIAAKAATEQLPAPSFPVDPATLDLLWGAIHPGPDGTRTTLFDALETLSDRHFGPATATEVGGVTFLDTPRWHPNDAIAALIAEVRRMREQGDAEPAVAGKEA